MSKAKKITTSHLEAVDQLLNLERLVAGLVHDHGGKFPLSPAYMLARLTQLPPERVWTICRTLTELHESLLTCSEKNIDPWDDHEFFSLSMQGLGFSAPPNFSKMLKSGDIVEGYDLEGRQIFRNMRFMEVTSYSLSEMLSQDWTALYDRPSFITERILTNITRVLQLGNYVQADIPAHFIRELRSVQPLVAEIRLRFFAPLFSGPQKPAGFLSVCQGRVIDAKLDVNRDNLTFL